MENGLDGKRTREQERAALYKALWGVANILRDVVEGWDFKQYTLGAMLYRFLSEWLAESIEKAMQECGYKDFSYAAMSDEEAESARNEMIDALGFFLLPSELFCNVIKNAADNKNLNEKLDCVFRHLEQSIVGHPGERSLSDLFQDFDVNSKKLGSSLEERNKVLADVLLAIAELDLSDRYSDSQIDAFGDAYEYLISLYASNAGKSGGEYFTPPEVSELLVRLATLRKKEIKNIYDPACGSGGLLLKAAKVLGAEHVLQGFFGEDKNLAIYNLCRANMLLHHVEYDKFDIVHGNTLLHPKHGVDGNEIVQRFEIIVSNPPYSTKWDGEDNAMLASDVRFTPAGVLPPKGRADFAFILHSLALLEENGTAAIVCFPGALYRGGKEAKIRQHLVDGNYVDCIIQLPPNLFYGTPIATCIMILKKNRTDTSVLFIDAGREFVKVPAANKLSEENIDSIVNLYADRREVPHVSRLVSAELIAKKKYDLSVSTYVEAEEIKEEIDIKALNVQLEELESQAMRLRREIDAIIAEIEGGA